MKRVGVFTPLYARPDFARYAAMQFAMQTRKPDHVAFYQNGEFPDYRWSISDLALPYQCHWIYSDRKKPDQTCWYSLPLKRLLDEGCDYCFWCDQDEMYRSTHIEESLQDLEQSGADLVINDLAGVLKVRPGQFAMETIRFTAHDPGGVSSSMAFNAAFASALYEDLIQNRGAHFWADNVVSKVTMPRFRVYRNPSRTSVTYTCHDGTVSSSHWLSNL